MSRLRFIDVLDSDTFGLVASPTMDAVQLGAQMRTIRPSVEHPAT